MDVLFVFPHLAGGMATLNAERDTALQANGIRCYYLYFSASASAKIIDKNRVFVLDKDADMKNLIASHQFQAVIVCTDYLFLKKLRNMGYRGKVVFENQGVGSRTSSLMWLKKCRPYVVRYANAILFPPHTFWEQQMAAAFPGLPQYSFPNCINAERYHQINVNQPEHVIVGWVGRLEKNKNWLEFLKIGARLCAEKQNLRLWFFHDTTYSTQQQLQQFAAQISKVGLQSYLEVFENIPRSEMQIYYSKIAVSGGVLCSTSLLEGFGYSIAEAMCCNCPVVATKSDGVENLILHNQTGKLYEQGDVATSVREIKELIENHSLRETISQAAAAHIQTEYTPSRYSQHFRTMLRNLGTG
ncbi:glycosyltransferase family 4 protein [Bacillus rubiinfantis]|uniref:glycosyltransferase family 4 protein n=1 Tax=Bacillus rubiinfantis TaxID=1499680 RepID=UPI0005AA2A85|nr:glycosyltransferase [Bacillus rubiinfantis]